MKKILTLIYLDPEQKKALQAEAKKRGMYTSQLTRHVLAEFLEKQRRGEK